MTIHWDFETVTETRTDEDGNGYQTEVRGPIRVWFHDSDPATDTADQTVDWRADNRQVTWASGNYPVEVKSVACYNELASVWPNLTDREIRIGLEAAFEKIEQR